MKICDKSEMDCWINFPSLSDKDKKKKAALPRRVVMVPLSAIESSQNPVRKRFDEVSILMLADSIRQHGMLQPIFVKKTKELLGDKARYVCVSGERRLRACRLLSLPLVPCFVLAADDSRAEDLQLLDHLHDEPLDLFSLSDWLLFRCLVKSLNATALASNLSVPQSLIENQIAAAVFDDDERDLILKSDLTHGQIMALLRVGDDRLRKKVLEFVVERGYNEKQTNEYIDSVLFESRAFVSHGADENLAVFEQGLNYCLRLLRAKGVSVQVEEFEHENEIQYLLRISKG